MNLYNMGVLGSSKISIFEGVRILRVVSFVSCANNGGFWLFYQQEIKVYIYIYLYTLRCKTTTPPIKRGEGSLGLYKFGQGKF